MTIEIDSQYYKCEITQVSDSNIPTYTSKGGAIFGGIIIGFLLFGIAMGVITSNLDKRK